MDEAHTMRPEVQAIVDRLLAATEPDGEVGLDLVGEEIGARAVSSDEVGAIIEALERAGRTVTGGDGGGSDDLRRVIGAARTLELRLGRRPGIDEIAAEAGLAVGAVRTALLLGRVMGR